MTVLHRLYARLRLFRDDTSGLLSVEAILVLPLLFWGYIGMFVLFEGFRNMNTSQKAAYTISDMLSRETTEIDSSYINSTRELLKYLTQQPDANARLRVSIVRWNEADDRYEIDWSAPRGAGLTPLATADLTDYETQLPVMPDEETVILVETWVDFHPPFQVGLDDVTYTNTVVTRPRFAPQLVWSGSQDTGTASDMSDD